MNSRIIKALLKKETALFLSNRFYLLITVVGLVLYIAIYFVLPPQTDEKLSLAMHSRVVPPAFSQLNDHKGISIEYFDDEDSLKEAVLNRDYQAALSLPYDIMETWAAGGKPEVTVYFASSATSEIHAIIKSLVKELSYIQTGQALNFETTEEILGPDMTGEQIALRDRMRPLFAVFILLVEILTLAGLIAVEIEQGTARALLVTPLRISELFAAKGILGFGLAFGQAVLFMGLVGGFAHQPFIILTALIIGSIMAVGIGFLLASAVRDVNAVTGWGMLVLLLMALPGFGLVIPGLISSWVKIIPSYYLTDTVNRVANYGAGWGDVGMNLVIMTSFSFIVIWAGMMTLRKRYQ